jgi:hypothetical protein
MNRKIKYLSILLMAVALFYSCDKEEHLFDSADAFVSFHTATVNVEETNKEIAIELLVNATKGSPAVDVSFEFDTTGIEGAVAEEGVDFEVVGDNAGKVSFADGYGTQTIVIRTINNDVFSGTKKVKIKITDNSLGYNTGSESEVIINITDDDHPLGWMLGDYSVTADIYRSGEVTWNMTLSPVEGDIKQVTIVGLFAGGNYAQPEGDPTYYVLGSVDMEAMTMTMKTGQNMVSWGWGPVTIVGWYADDTDVKTGDPLTFDIVQDGDNVSIVSREYYGIYIYEGNNAGLYLEYTMDIPVTWVKK